jgi:o-succinylbenzoate---CoA ligase
MDPTDLKHASFWRSGRHELTTAGPVPSSRAAPSDSLLVQTSGSEGRPKWVVLGKAGFLTSAQAVNTHLEATAKDRWLVALPQSHVGGFAIHARAHLSGASTANYIGKWQAHSFAQACRETRATLTSLVPTQVVDLVRAGLQAPAPLRAVIVGGGSIERSIALRALELGWPILQSYGMTEACSQIATEPIDHLYAGHDPDTLEVLPIWDTSTNELGQLVLRGEALALGYIISDADSSERWQPIDPNTGMITRDQVSLWQHGTRRFLRFISRDADAVKVLGELLHLGPLQARLESIAHATSFIGRVQILALPDERSGCKLSLVHEPGTAITDLIAAYNAMVRGPERLTSTIAVDRIPLSPLGKVRMAELTAMIHQQTKANPPTSQQLH